METMERLSLHRIVRIYIKRNDEFRKNSSRNTVYKSVQNKIKEISPTLMENCTLLLSLSEYE